MPSKPLRQLTGRERQIMDIVYRHDQFVVDPSGRTTATVTTSGGTSVITPAGIVREKVPSVRSAGSPLTSGGLSQIR